jgi:predicted flap endonuclease-1-like 5' DNA nuclease
VRSGATSSRQPRRRLAAVGLVLLAGLAAGGAVMVVQQIERDLDRRIARSLREAGYVDVVVPVRVQDGIYRTETLGLWLAGLVAAALLGLVLGLLMSRARRRPVDPDDAALLRQGWRVEAMTVPAPAAPAPVVERVERAEEPIEEPLEPVAAAAVAPTRTAATEPLVFDVGSLLDPGLGTTPPHTPAPASMPPRQPTRQPARRAVQPPPARDDLTAVSGIDDDVAALLRANGITSWERLGHAEVGDLRALLDLEGPRFHACQPGTWPIQGRLLAAGDWSSWRALVDGLRDGRPIWR